MDHLDERLANHGRWWAQTAGDAIAACLSRRATVTSINGEYGYYLNHWGVYSVWFPHLCGVDPLRLEGSNPSGSARLLPIVDGSSKMDNGHG